MATSERAEALAARFEAANLAVREAIAGASDDQLRATCTAERCTVAALACHIATVHEAVLTWVRSAIAGNGLPTLTMEDVDRANTEGFARDAGCSREEALARLAHAGKRAAEELRGMSDAELDLTAPFALFGGAVVSVHSLIEQVMIGDPLAHLPSIQAALTAVPQSVQRREQVATSV